MKIKIPNVGLGGGLVTDVNTREKQYEIYDYAIKSGLVHLIDTSSAYGDNEQVLGEALNNNPEGTSVYIMTKVSNIGQRDGDIRRALERSLRLLGRDYIEIYLIHWPQHGTFLNTWSQMERLYEEGLVHSIGVCNFEIHHLRELMSCANIMPQINEFENHPLMTQDALINYCRAFDIIPISYSPIARMHDVLIKSQPVYECAKKYEKTPAQVILAWHKQLGHIAIPRTTNINHFKELFDVSEEFELDYKDVCWISSLNNNTRLRYDPDWADFSRL